MRPPLNVRNHNLFVELISKKTAPACSSAGSPSPYASPTSAPVACHIRATRYGDQRSVTVTHGQEHPAELHRRFRWSPDVACYRSSKLVMRVRFPSPAPPGHRHLSKAFEFRQRRIIHGPDHSEAAGERASRRNWPRPSVIALSRSRLACCTVSARRGTGRSPQARTVLWPRPPHASCASVRRQAMIVRSLRRARCVPDRAVSQG
jgi:hypothetical protein